MTCKDCIYFLRCVVLGVELDIKRNKEADKNCRHFKNKSDYAEVVHGEWIEITNDVYFCSKCNRTIWFDGKSKDSFPYCHCGAKMGAK